MGRVKVNLRRVTLVRSKALEQDPIYVIASSFGLRKSSFRVGKVVQRNERSVDVEFIDRSGGEEEKYAWRFSTSTGVRTRDVGNDSGWMIDLNDLKRWKPPVRTARAQNRVRKLDEQVVEYPSGQDELVWNVWEDTTTGERFLQAFRRRIDGTGRHRVGLVPFSKLLEVLAQFNVTWKDEV